MTRMSKQQRKRAVSPKRPKTGFLKTGSKKDLLPKGYKEHANAVSIDHIFIPKIK